MGGYYITHPEMYSYESLRWHSGNGHHGAGAYWRVIEPNGGVEGVIR